MPEEINRLLTDRISDLLFVIEQSGIDNLRNEGTDFGKVYLAGNVMIDTLFANKENAKIPGWQSRGENRWNNIKSLITIIALKKGLSGIGIGSCNWFGNLRVCIV
jgi:UDP-N-acetylglucosamine 2-epimerase